MAVKFLIVLLLMLSLAEYIRIAQCRTLVDLAEEIEVGSIDFKGSKLSVFEQDGFQFAEPSIQLDKFCGIVEFNYVYLKYQLTVPIILETGALQKPLDDSKRVGKLTVSKLDAHLDDGLASEDSKIRVLVLQRRGSEDQLLFLCDEFERCDRLRIELVTNPQRMQWALQFSATGVVSGGIRVRFSPRPSSNPPPAVDCVTDKWVVFQRRVDGTVSFAQNWKTYEQGFGNSHSNYWMGLKQLSALTATSEHTAHGNTARCQLKVEVIDQHGNKHWGQYKYFQVLTSVQTYRLRVMEELPGTTIQQMHLNHEMRFSTYDKDHDNWGPGSVSTHYGHGGWWFNQWAPLNANGAYPPKDAKQTHRPAYLSAFVGGNHLVMKSSVLMFKCG